MKRRDFVKMGALSVPSFALAQSLPQQSKARTVAAGADRLGETHTLGFSKIAFKASPADTEGGLFIMEHSNLTKGGPYRHVHPAQDEWLYAMEGEFRVEIGDQKLTLRPGDSVLMPRKVPHVWAQVGETPGKLLIAFTPAGRMEEFFRDFGKTGKLPTDPDVVKAYGLERVGPPLSV
ncbi:cupin domain-containing protein [Terriglobus roseus]|uniref:Cupin domain-containing protein n=1 Tax=Terriglobus roseus TaxID=392734 RepID=A0A1G7HI17_9BACT|nr:cupin domain-containing protein [Terriglobus roseus]SDF00122.1 Cupin domain-containing protein [Terriglobus roseus]